VSLATHADDAHRLLAELTDEPAWVFGNSIGALIGLELIARHPEQVRRLIAHEPPVWALLPDAERDHAAHTQLDVETAFARQGVAAAFQKFGLLFTVDFQDREPDVVLAPPTPPRAANLSFFFTHDSPAVRRYQPDVAALQAVSKRILCAAGRGSRESPVYRATAALAATLGQGLAEFPGGHTAWLLRPRGFAIQLRDILD
jgi:pimeloyl-ACP methyl ester carboxylesterase